MNGRRAIWVLVLWLLTGPALADDYVNGIVSELQSEGYGRIVVEYTLLGRVQIRASRTDLSREVVVNPHTGEILRDLKTRIPPVGKSGDDGKSDDGQASGNDSGDDKEGGHTGGSGGDGND